MARATGLDLANRPKSRIARLPRPLRRPALLLHALLSRDGRDGYAHVGDGLATDHFGPFVRDAQFQDLYRRLAGFWEPAAITDMRWRMWVLTRAARQCRGLSGDFAEFGTWRGGCAFMMLGTSAVPPDRRLWLFDTFSGIPAHRLTAREAAAGFAGRFGDTEVVEHLESVLAPWAGQFTLCRGDVFDTVPRPDVERLAFMHIDLNASAATRHVLENQFSRVVAGGIVVFDDYGWAGYEDQRDVIDDFFACRREEVIALPTGQALVAAR